MAEGDEAVLSADDDNFHAWAESRWFAHETCWFSFYAPERKGLGAWAYNYVRPNIGISGGTVIIWDEDTAFHMEIPYYRAYSAMPLAPERDLRDFTFPTGVSIKVLKPLQSYSLTFDDTARMSFDLTFDAIMPPWVHAVGHSADHLDQIGRVHGSLVLHGEDIPIDCYAMRDRSWRRPRSEKWEVTGSTNDPDWQADGGRPVGYTWASNGTKSILVRGYDDIHMGFLDMDGRRALIDSGTRQVQRGDDGFIETLQVTGQDVLGRSFDLHCRSVSRVAMPFPGVAGVCWTSTLDCTLNGDRLWGEDQDLFTLYGWSSFRRRTRAKRGGASASR